MEKSFDGRLGDLVESLAVIGWEALFNESERRQSSKVSRHVVMKKIFISVGLVAAGATGLQSACAAGLDVISPKAWNVSATLRGFYDDNYAISSAKKGSFGVELSPQISFNVPLQQTDLGMRYIYGLYYYQQRQDLGVNAFDQTHQFDLWLDHSFNERWRVKLTDTLAIGQEPALLQPNQGAGAAIPYRIEGDNLANHALITLNTDWTRLFSTAIHYGNNYYDYDNSGASLMSPQPLFPPFGTQFGMPVSTPGVSGFNSLNAPGASYAGLLNRIEQSAGIDFQWHLQQETMLFVGYNFSLVNYTGDEPIAVFNYVDNYVDQSPASRSVVYRSDSRDSMTHYGYVGVQHDFTSNLSGMARGGVSYTDSYNDPLQNSTSLAPYADLNISYTYIPGSYVQLGFTHDINSTDVATVGSNGSLTQYQESSVVYADINHRFTPKLLGTAVARYQYSTFEGGASTGGGDSSFGFGLNVYYAINPHFYADAGYNYDNMKSDLGGRGYERNRVYIGLGANY